MVALGRVGVWSGLRSWEPGAVGAAAAAVESSGYGALWIPGGGGGDVLDRCRAALDATTDLVVATGIVNIWRHDAREVAAESASLRAASGDRFVLGLGVSHERLIGEEYVAPLAKMRSYLDELDAAGQPAEVRVLAALRSRMLELARSRSAGAHPYFVPPEHSAVARAALGPGPLLAPEQTVVLEADPAAARALARQFCARYLPLPNYTDNLRALGYTDEDLAPPGSDRLVDAVVAWGSAATIAARVQAHLDAGADHVCLQVVRDDDGPSEADVWLDLAGPLLH
jgi:probable F420-dependent oxidoreductase